MNPKPRILNEKTQKYFSPSSNLVSKYPISVGSFMENSCPASDSKIQFLFFVKTKSGK
jgi:hypothetical protein